MIYKEDRVEEVVDLLKDSYVLVTSHKGLSLDPEMYDREGFGWITNSDRVRIITLLGTEYFMMQMMDYHDDNDINRASWKEVGPYHRDDVFRFLNVADTDNSKNTDEKNEGKQSPEKAQSTKTELTKKGILSWLNLDKYQIGIHGEISSVSTGRYDRRVKNATIPSDILQSAAVAMTMFFATDVATRITHRTVQLLGHDKENRKKNFEIDVFDFTAQIVEDVFKETPTVVPIPVLASITGFARWEIWCVINRTALVIRTIITGAYAKYPSRVRQFVQEQEARREELEERKRNLYQDFDVISMVAATMGNKNARSFM